MYNKLIENGLGQLMDKRIFKLLENDEVYLKDCTNLEELERRYSKLELSVQNKRIINEYIACIETTFDRYGKISYFAGAKDTISFLVVWD